MIFEYYRLKGKKMTKNIFNNALDKNIDKIHKHGYWYGNAAVKFSKFDEKLALGIVHFLKKEKAQSVVDFGCGSAEYVKFLLKHNINCKGYDGNPDTPVISDGFAQIIDLSKLFNLNWLFDWVISLEVGEHLPAKYEKIFIENLHRHNKEGIILSWALKGQKGFGHFNEQNNDYIKKIMQDLGYTNDPTVENDLRKSSELRWFKNTIMVFRKPSK